MRRPTGAILTLLDDDKLLSELKKVYKKLMEDEGSSKEQQAKELPLVRLYSKMASFYDKLGRLNVVSTEGVYSYDVGNGVVPVHASWGMSMIQLPVKVEVLTSLTTRETIDASKFVRSFGDRLDMNVFSIHNAYGRKA